MTTMKFAGAALVALAASAGAAHAQATGSVGLNYQSTDAGGSSDLEAASIDAALQFNDNLQINGRFADIEGGEANIWGVDAFLSTRNDSYGYGAFVGYSSIDGEDSELAIGGFGQLYRGNTNWTAQLGYADTESSISITHLDGEGRFFLTENISVQANLGYGNIDNDFGGDDYWTAGVGAEWQITGSNVSLNGGWQRVEFANGSTDTLGAGIRFHLDGGSLMDRSRSGASLTRATPTAFELEAGGGNAGFVPR